MERNSRCPKCGHLAVPVHNIDESQEEKLLLLCPKCHVEIEENIIIPEQNEGMHTFTLRPTYNASWCLFGHKEACSNLRITKEWLK